MFLKRIFLVCFLIVLSWTANATLCSDTVIVINAGRNGNNTANLLSRVNKDVLQEKPDVVVMMVGTNDMFNESNHLSIDRFKNNYQRLITIIKQHANLILMTIPPVYAPYIIERKPVFKFGPNGPDLKDELANMTIKYLAEKNHCTMIDLHHIIMACGGATAEKSSLIRNVVNSGISSGVHPNYDGTRVIATAVYQTIKILYPDAKKIICFGDSITRGYRLKGEGTTEGEPYPAVLQRMFTQ